MLGTHELLVDQWAEVYDLLQPYADGSFWELPLMDPKYTYIIGRVLLKQHWTEITEFATRNPGRVVFSNPAEGSETVLLQLKRLRIEPHVRDGRIRLLTSGDLEPGWNYCATDCYFANIVEYTENIQAAHAIEQHSYREAESGRAGEKPYKFLFLNGRLRPHRKALIDQLRSTNTLDHALWTNLGGQVEMSFTSILKTNTQEPIRLLPPEYEIERAVPNLTTSLHESTGFVKHDLFNNTWGDAIVNPRCYTDTYFSLVTETIYDYPYTFRTEKIWKPTLSAHPFIVAANPGYLRDLHSVGFRTFGTLIDESYDSVHDPRERIERVAAVVKDLCEGTRARDFARAARDICVYNQNRLKEYNREQRAALPELLQQYIDRVRSI